MKKQSVKLVFCWLMVALAVVSCSKVDGYKKKLDVPYQKMEPQKVEIIEYDRAFFGIDTANFEEGIKAIRPQFESLLGESLNDEQIKYLKDFATDTFVLKLNRLVRETFPDIDFVADKVKGVYQHLSYYYPLAELPQTYTYISGVNYENGPVMITQDNFMISLDYYLSNKEGVYDQVGMPRYMSRRFQPASLTKDLAEAVYYISVYNNYIAKNALIEMVERGKKLYFIEAMDPTLPDSIIMGYSSKQMEWAIENEGHLWASVVGNDMLYSNNNMNQRVLFADGPFTAAYGGDAPARLGEFLGLQIVRSFMSHNEVSLTELMNMTDQQYIFQQSQYKPKK